MADKIEQHTAKSKINTIVFSLPIWWNKHSWVYTDVMGNRKRPMTNKQELWLNLIRTK